MNIKNTILCIGHEYHFILIQVIETSSLFIYVLKIKKIMTESMLMTIITFIHIYNKILIVNTRVGFLTADCIVVLVLVFSKFSCVFE